MSRNVGIHEQIAKRYTQPFKQQWKQISDKRIFVRSKWEWYYACYLQILKEDNQIKDWFHEPKTFYFEGIKRGTNNYKIDFQVIHNNIEEEWVEVKGFMDKKSATKIKRMAKYHPSVKLRIIDAEWFKHNLKSLKFLIRKFE
jgi:hypothetical protein